MADDPAVQDASVPESPRTDEDVSNSPRLDDDVPATPETIHTCGSPGALPDDAEEMSAEEHGSQQHVVLNEEIEAESLEKLKALVEEYEAHCSNLNEEVDAHQEVALAIGIAWERLEILLDGNPNQEEVEAEGEEGSAREAPYVYTTYREKALIAEAYNVLQVPVDTKKEILEMLYVELMKTIGKHNNAKKRCTVVSAVARINETHRRMLKDIPNGKIHMLYWRCIKYGLEGIADAYVQAHSNLKEIEGKVTQKKIKNRVTKEEAKLEQKMRQVGLINTLLFGLLKAGEAAYRREQHCKEEYDLESSSSSSSSSSDDVAPKQITNDGAEEMVVVESAVDPHVAFFAGFRVKKSDGESIDYPFSDGVLLQAIRTTVFGADYIYIKRKKLREILKITGNKLLDMDDVTFNIDRTVDAVRHGTNRDRKIRFFVRRIQRAVYNLFELIESHTLLLLNSEFRSDTSVDKIGTPVYIIRTRAAEVDEDDQNSSDRACQERIFEALKCRGFNSLTKVDDVPNPANTTLNDGSSLLVLKHELRDGEAEPHVTESHYLSNLYPFINVTSAVDDLLGRLAGENGFFLSDEILDEDEEDEEVTLMANNEPSKFYFEEAVQGGEDDAAPVFHRVYTTSDGVLVYVHDVPDAPSEVRQVFPPEADNNAAVAEEKLNHLYIQVVMYTNENEEATKSAEEAEVGALVPTETPAEAQVTSTTIKVPVREAQLQAPDEYSSAAEVIIYNLVQRFKPAEPKCEAEPEADEAEAVEATEGDAETAAEQEAEAEDAAAEQEAEAEDAAVEPEAEAEDAAVEPEAEAEDAAVEPEAEAEDAAVEPEAEAEDAAAEQEAEAEDAAAEQEAEAEDAAAEQEAEVEDAAAHEGEGAPTVEEA